MLSKNMCKLPRKFHNVKIYPLEVQILQIIFLCHFMDNLGNNSTYLSPHYQNSFFSKLDFLFSVLGSMVSKKICKFRHKMKMPKIYSNSLGHDKIKLDISRKVGMYKCRYVEKLKSR